MPLKDTPSGVVWVLFLSLVMASASVGLLFDEELRTKDLLPAVLMRDSKIVRNVMHAAFITVFLCSFWKGNSVLGYFFPLIGAFFSAMVGLQTTVLGALQLSRFGSSAIDIFAFASLWFISFASCFVGIYYFGKSKNLGNKLAIFPPSATSRKHGSVRFELLLVGNDGCYTSETNVPKVVETLKESSPFSTFGDDEVASINSAEAELELLPKSQLKKPQEGSHQESPAKSDGGGELPNSFLKLPDHHRRLSNEEESAAEITEEMNIQADRLRIALIVEIIYVILYTSAITVVRAPSALAGPPLSLPKFFPEFVTSFTVSAGHRGFILATGFTAASRCVSDITSLFLIGNGPFCLFFVVEFFVALFAGQSPYSVAALLLQVWVMAASIYFAINLRVLCHKRDQRKTQNISENGSSLDGNHPPNRARGSYRPTLFSLSRDLSLTPSSRRWSWWSGVFSILIFSVWIFECVILSSLGINEFSKFDSRFFRVDVLQMFNESLNAGAHASALLAFLFYICVQNKAAFSRLRIMNVILGILVASLAIFQGLRLWNISSADQRNYWFYAVIFMFFARAIANIGISVSFYKFRFESISNAAKSEPISPDDEESSDDADDDQEIQTYQREILAYNRWKIWCRRFTLLYCVSIGVYVFGVTVHEAKYKDLSLIFAGDDRSFSDIGTHTQGYTLVYHFCYIVPLFILHSVSHGFLISGDIAQQFLNMLSILLAVPLFVIGRNVQSLHQFWEDAVLVEQLLALLIIVSLSLNFVFVVLTSLTLRRFRTHLENITTEKVSPTFLFGFER